MMKKKVNVQRFVQLVEKRNGRIYKNQSIKLEDFRNKIGLYHGRSAEKIETSWYDKLFYTETYQESLRLKKVSYKLEVEEKLSKRALKYINTLIDNDTTSQTKRKNKKK